MTTYPIVQLVDAPDLDAAVLVDFDKAGFRPLHSGFSLGAPEFLGDPEGVGAEWGPRAISFVAETREASESDARLLMSDVARVVLRPLGAYLFFQLTATAPPVWARLLRSSPGSFSLEDVFLDRDTQRWRLSVSLNADPFLLGDRVALGPYTVNNSPSFGTYPMRVTLPEILGDAPAPLDIWCEDTYFTFGLVSVSEVSLPRQEAEDCTLGPDASVNANAFSSSGFNVGITFATETDLVTRLTWAVEADITDDTARAFLTENPRARLLAYVGAGATAGVFSMQGAVDSGLSLVYGDEVVVDMTGLAGQTRLVDLGTLPLTAGAEGNDVPTDGLPSLEVLVGRTSGVGAELFVDFLLLVAGDRVLMFGREESATVSVHTFVDSEREQIVPALGTVSAPRLRGNLFPAAARGGFPDVRPGETNELLWIVGEGGFSPQAEINLGTTSDVTLAYRPRYLYLAG